MDYCKRRAYTFVFKVMAGSDVLAIGGFDGANRLGTVERFDVRANKWDTSIPDMPTRRDKFACVGLST